MPVLENVTTKTAEQVWQSPDGQRKIYKLGLEWQGKAVEAKTYSDAIGTIGWQGTIETYEKPGRQGSETFVRQLPKEGGFSGQSATPRGSTGSKFQADPFTMYLSYAKDLVVATIEKAAKPLDYSDAIQLALGGAYELYNGRPEAKTEEVGTPPAAATDNAPKPDEVVTDIGDAPLSAEDLASIDDIFGKKEE